MEPTVHTIDAAGKSPGRLATTISVLLRGKHKADFVPYKADGDQVIVKNVDKLKITGRKAEQKRFYRHTGYPGGLRSETVQEVMNAKPQEVLKKAVSGMLPRTKLKKEQMARLKFE